MIENDILIELDEIHLSGTLTLPKGNAPFPTVVILSGSGKVNRDGNLKKFKLNLYNEISQYLSEHGIATLRYDKRGVAQSEGNYYTTGFYDNVADAMAVIEFAKCHTALDPKKIFLLGHSEGAIIATQIAARTSWLAGAILLAGYAQRGDDALQRQLTEVLKGLKGFQRLLLKILPIDPMKSLSKLMKKINESEKATIRVKLFKKFNAKWARELLNYDPSEDFKKITIPILAITGEKDIQVPPADLKRMRDLISSDFESHCIPNLTHVLRRDYASPSINHYKKLTKQPVDRELLEIIKAWTIGQASS